VRPCVRPCVVPVCGARVCLVSACVSVSVCMRVPLCAPSVRLHLHVSSLSCGWLYAPAVRALMFAHALPNWYRPCDDATCR
jgi:hypothetical protein